VHGAASGGTSIAPILYMIAGSAMPFDSIESAHEYVTLLREVLVDAQATIQHEIASPSAEATRRHLDALRLVDYKLRALEQHFVASGRLLNDLRTLRRYLRDERTTTSDSDPQRTTAIESEAAGA
jgi:hypothetical protein